jgi:hypothetical protein
MHLICKKFQIQIIECKDSTDSRVSPDQYKIVMKLTKVGKNNEHVLLEGNHELARQLEDTLCSPEDEMFSEPELVSEEKFEESDHESNDDNEMEDLGAYGNEVSLESPNEFNGANDSAADKADLEDFRSALLSNLRLVNGKFRLKNNISDGLKYFSRVKHWNNRSMKSNSLSSGDVVKAGDIEFRVDIRAAPRPISDKRREDIVSGKDIGSFEFPNWFHRENMEDRLSVIDGFGKFSTDAFFGIYDGHAGRSVADFVSCVFHSVIRFFNDLSC